MKFKQIKLQAILTLSLMIMFFACMDNNNNKIQKDTLPPDALGALQTVTFELGGVEVEIEIANTPVEQAQGLMYRTAMPENHGMLFVNREPRYLSFWMKNTRLALSIAYIRDDLVIGNILKMKPQVCEYEPSERYHSKYKSLYALEMNQGWFEKHGVKAGDKIALPLDKIDEIIIQSSTMINK
jgi:uncharacterized protein